MDKFDNLEKEKQELAKENEKAELANKTKNIAGEALRKWKNQIKEKQEKIEKEEAALAKERSKEKEKMEKQFKIFKENRISTCSELREIAVYIDKVTKVTGFAKVIKYRQSFTIKGCVYQLSCESYN